MTDFVKNPKWSTGVRQLETSDPVLAGPDGVDNIAPRQLSERTDFLKEFLDNQYGVINNTDGTLKSSLVLPVSKGGIGLSAVPAGYYLRGTSNTDIMEVVSPADLLGHLKLFAYYDQAPITNVGPLIYVLGKGLMEWQTIGSWSGYARLDIGSFVPDTTPMPRSMTIDAIGGTFSKTTYPGLWAWAQWTGHVVGAASWKEGQYKFVDLGGTSFKVPDLRNQFIRMTGTDADNANARGLGSHQADAVRQQRYPVYAAMRGGNMHTLIKEELDSMGLTGGVGVSDSVDKGMIYGYAIFGNAYETRPSNTALAPRLIAY